MLCVLKLTARVEQSATREFNLLAPPGEVHVFVELRRFSIGFERGFELPGIFLGPHNVTKIDVNLYQPSVAIKQVRLIPPLQVLQRKLKRLQRCLVVPRPGTDVTKL
jgi:hypothetical protein